MEKPIILQIKDLKEKIIDDVNKAKLPIFIIEPIVKEIYSEIVEKKQELLKTETLKYEKEVKNKDKSFSEGERITYEKD